MFLLSARDNDLLFFRGRSDVARCPSCDGLLDKWSEDLTSVPIARAPRADLSYSLDGVLVASRRCVEALAASDAMFLPLARDLFALRPRAVVAFDATRRGTRFERHCASCSRYRDVVGATPVYLLDGASVASTAIARTDLEFGSDDEKHPLVLCGDAVAEELRRLRGIDLRRL